MVKVGVLESKVGWTIKYKVYLFTVKMASFFIAQYKVCVCVCLCGE